MITKEEKENKKSVIPIPNNIPYLLAVFGMLTIAIISVVVITIMRPELDFIVVVASITGVIMPTTLSLLAFMKAQETHLSVNSRLDSFIRNAEDAARLIGEDEGRRKANDRTDLLAGKNK